MIIIMDAMFDLNLKKLLELDGFFSHHYVKRRYKHHTKTVYQIFRSSHERCKLGMGQLT